MKNRLPAVVLSVVSALLLAACASTGYSDRYDSRSAYDGYDRYDTSYDSRYGDRYARCDRCGRVIDIERYYGEGRASGAGAVAGAVVGGVGAWMFGRLLESLIPGISARDTATFGLTVAVLLSVAMLSSWVPARWAAATDPMETLRTE